MDIHIHDSPSHLVAWWPLTTTDDDANRNYREAMRRFSARTDQLIADAIEEVETALEREARPPRLGAIRDWSVVRRLAGELGLDAGDERTGPPREYSWGSVATVVTLALLDVAVEGLVGEIPDRYDPSVRRAPAGSQVPGMVAPAETSSVLSWSDWPARLAERPEARRVRMARAAGLHEDELAPALTIGTQALRAMPALRAGTSLVYGRYLVRITVSDQVTVEAEAPFYWQTIADQTLDLTGDPTVLVPRDHDLLVVSRVPVESLAGIPKPIPTVDDHAPEEGRSA